MAIFSRFLAGQFGRPKGWIGRRLIGLWLDRISQEMNRLAIEQMAVGEEDDVLEVGFGGAALLARLLEQTKGQVTGVDLSREMVDRARRRFGKENRLKLHVGSVQALPMASESVDKACSVNNVYFWPEPAAAFTELARVVRPGGTLSLCFEPPSELRKWPGHVHGFALHEEKELRELMSNAGFGAFRLAEGVGRKPDYFLCLTGERLAPGLPG